MCGSALFRFVVAACTAGKSRYSTVSSFVVKIFVVTVFNHKNHEYFAQRKLPAINITSLIDRLLPPDFGQGRASSVREGKTLTPGVFIP